MTERMTKPLPMRTVTVMLQLQPAVYRALLQTATKQGTQVHQMIEAKLTAAVEGRQERKPIRPHTPITHSDEATWVALWRKGWSDSRIAREVGRVQSTVSHRLRDLGFPSNLPVEPRKPITRATIAEMVRLWGEGMTDTQIAVRVDRGRSTVSRKLRDMGYEANGRQGLRMPEEQAA